jgi:hypothetical protein
MVVSLYKWPLLLLLMLVFSGFTPVHERRMDRLAPVHPFFVSVTEINHNANQATVEISCKLFIDDFENTLKDQYKSKVDLSEPKDRKQLEKLIFDYMQKHLQLKINGKAAALSFVGFETESESAWCYLEIKQVPQIKSLTISNDLLYESHSTQINIIHALVGGERKSTKLVNPEKQVGFEW